LKYTLQITHQFIVPNPKYPKTSCCEKGIALFIVLRLFGMLPTVELQDQVLVEADEIDNVSPNRLLTLEFQAAKTVSAESCPKDTFSISGPLTKIS